jgi:hypothetical protein
MLPFSSPGSAFAVGQIQGSEEEALPALHDDDGWAGSCKLGAYVPNQGALDPARTGGLEVRMCQEPQYGEGSRTPRRPWQCTTDVHEELGRVETEQERERREIPEDPGHRVVAVELIAVREEIQEQEEAQAAAQQPDIRPIEAGSGRPGAPQEWAGGLRGQSCHEEVGNEAEERGPVLGADEEVARVGQQDLEQTLRWHRVGGGEVMQKGQPVPGREPEEDRGRPMRDE